MKWYKKYKEINSILFTYEYGGIMNKNNIQKER